MTRPLVTPQRLLRQLRDRFGAKPSPPPPPSLQPQSNEGLDIDLDALAWGRTDDDWLTRPAVQLRPPQSH